MCVLRYNIIKSFSIYWGVAYFDFLGLSCLIAEETTLLLIRHGQTVWNQEGRFLGQTDQPLNEEGRRQAEEVGKQIKENYPLLAACYSSDLSRAHETASIVAKYYGLPVVLMPDLRESSFGILEGMLGKDVKKQYGEELDAFYKKYPDREERRNHSPFPGMETVNELENRVRRALLKIGVDHSQETVAVFSHGMAIKAFLSGLKQCDLDEIETPNCALFRISFHSDRLHPFVIFD